MPKQLFPLIFLFITLCKVPLSAQTPLLGIKNIDSTLLNHANSVVRLDRSIVNIPNRRTLEIEKTLIVTVLNRKGDNDASAYAYYDDVTKIKELKAQVYDRYGKEIKEFKKRDFKDVAAVDGISIFTDSRVMYLDYTPTEYPYTLVFNVTTISANTAFLPQFYANNGYLSSTERAYLEFNFLPELGLRSKLINNNDVIKVQEAEGKFTYEVLNVPALKPESFSPGFQKIVSKAIFTLDYFHLEGVDGQATTWQSFGKWMDDYLLAGTSEIPESTAQDIRALVKDENNLSEKVRLIYEYMQNRTRYISVQVGIGGWKPMLASEVDELGYGDCKALSNYTKSLLEVAEIPSYYTILYGDKDKRDIQKDFPSVQGNHAILAVPVDDDFIWLECTDQNVPYGFIADFTDDRDVLVVTPDGGQIVHTKIYKEQDNSQFLQGKVTLNEKGGITASVTMVSSGTQYDDRFFIERSNDDDQKKYYYKFWDYINNISLESIKLSNDKKKATLTEEITFSAESYATFAGDEMIVPLNTLNRFTQLPNKNKNRIYDIEIDRGFKDQDEVHIVIPNGREVSALPDQVSITGDYGTYNCAVTQVGDNELVYKRSFIFNEGSYSKEDYSAFRKFLKDVVRRDNQKIILSKLK